MAAPDPALMGAFAPHCISCCRTLFIGVAPLKSHDYSPRSKSGSGLVKALGASAQSVDAVDPRNGPAAEFPISRRRGCGPCGGVGEWLNPADCKSARFGVRWFESSPLHHLPYVMLRRVRSVGGPSGAGVRSRLLTHPGSDWRGAAPPASFFAPSNFLGRASLKLRAAVRLATPDRVEFALSGFFLRILTEREGAAVALRLAARQSRPRRIISSVPVRV